VRNSIPFQKKDWVSKTQRDERVQRLNLGDQMKVSEWCIIWSHYNYATHTRPREWFETHGSIKQWRKGRVNG
jgi:hypothetical protein